MAVAAETVFNVETEHDTASRTMTQFIKPFTIVVDWEKSTITINKGNIEVQVISFADDDFSLSRYEMLLLEVEKSANLINRGKDGNKS